MSIEILNENVISKIRSSFNINSIKQCVTELVLNSLDAKSTAIAVRINLQTFRIQVVDNGHGISHSNLEQVGIRYMTSKCHKLEDLQKRPNYYGFRGEALASISKLSTLIDVTSKYANSCETFSKTIKNDKHNVNLVKDRPSFGTTVTVEGFLDNIPVRQQCTKNSELDNVRKSLENLSIIHPGVSFSLRNDMTGNLLFNNQKSPNVIKSFKLIHTFIDEKLFTFMKVAKSKIIVEGLLYKELYEKKLQYIYVNKRPIMCGRIQKLIKNLYQKQEKSHKSPIYVIQIKCPYSEVDFLLEPTVTYVQFKNISIILNCIEKLMNAFLGVKIALNEKINKTKKFERLSVGGVSQLIGCVRGVAIKRKIEEADEVSPKKISKIIENVKKEKNKSVSTDDDLFDNEYKGKDLIMTKFMKSIQEIFHLPEDSKSDYNLNDSDLPEKQKSDGKLLNLIESPELSEIQESVDGLLDLIESQGLPKKCKSIGKLSDLDESPELTEKRKSDGKLLDLCDSPELPEKQKSGGKLLDSCDSPEKRKSGGKLLDLCDSPEYPEKRKSVTEILHFQENSEMPQKKSKDKLNKPDLFQIEYNLGDSDNQSLINNPESFQKNKKPKSKFTIHDHLQSDSDLSQNKKSIKVPQNSKSDVRFPEINNCLEFVKNDRICVPSNNVVAVKKSKQFKSTAIQTTFLKVDEEKLLSNINKIQEKMAQRQLLTKSVSDNNIESYLNEMELKSKFMQNFQQNFAKTACNLFDNDKSRVFNFGKNQETVKEKRNFNVTTLETARISPIPKRENKKRILRNRKTILSLKKSEEDSRHFQQKDDDKMMWETFLTNKNIEIVEKKPKNYDFNKTSKYFTTFTNKSENFENVAFSTINKTSEYFKQQTENINFTETSQRNFKEFSFYLNENSFKLNFTSKFFQTETNKTFEEKSNNTEFFRCEKNSVNDIFTKVNNTENSEIIITFDEEEKQKIFKQDLNFEYQLNNNLKSQTQTTNNWMREINNFGQVFYTNKQTGIALFSSPKQEPKFSIEKRFDFIPKGLSPVLKDFEKVNDLSPVSKNRLQNAFMEAFDDDLLLVKWQNYINNNNPKEFFDQIYEEKSKLIDNHIPNINKSSLPTHFSTMFTNCSFTKDLFHNMELIGQIDCKFIAVKMNNFLLLFDQHAIHERVRLELLLQGYKNSSTKLEQSLALFLPNQDLLLITNQQLNLTTLGLIFEPFRNGITIHQIPTCVYNKFRKGGDLNDLIQCLIKEIVETLKTNDGLLLNSPTLIQNIINSEACRGAIKFGDKLTKDECLMHLNNLSKCKLPFQCAHGRPTLTPLIYLENVDLKTNKLNLWKLKNYI